MRVVIFCLRIRPMSPLMDASSYQMYAQMFMRLGLKKLFRVNLHFELSKQEATIESKK